MGKKIYVVKYMVMLEPSEYEGYTVEHWPQWLWTRGKMTVTAPDIDRAYSDTKRHLEYLYATEGRTVIDITGIKLHRLQYDVDHNTKKVKL